MVKLDGAAGFPEAVRADRRAGIPVFAQMGITQGNAATLRHRPREDAGRRDPGAAGNGRARSSRKRSCSKRPAPRCIDFTSSGPVAGAAVVAGGVDSGDRRPGRRARGSTAACAWRTPRSATRAAPSTSRPTPTPTSRRSRSTRSAPTPTTCARARQIKGGIPLKPAGLMATATIDGIATRYEVSAPARRC